MHVFLVVLWAEWYIFPTPCPINCRHCSPRRILVLSAGQGDAHFSPAAQFAYLLTLRIYFFRSLLGRAAYTSPPLPKFHVLLKHCICLPHSPVGRVAYRLPLMPKTSYSHLIYYFNTTHTNNISHIQKSM